MNWPDYYPRTARQAGPRREVFRRSGDSTALQTKGKNMKWNYIARTTSWAAPLAGLAHRLGALAALGLTLSAMLVGRPTQGAQLYSSPIYSTTQAVAAITCA